MGKVRKFKCIKSYKEGEWVTNGKIYEYVDGIITFDDGYKSYEPEDFLNTTYLDGVHWSHYLVEIVDKKQPIISNIEHVTFSNPATIVHFTDGTKTIVRTNEHDTYNPTVGFLYAYFEKMSGMSKTQCGKFFDNLEEEYAQQLEKRKKKQSKKNKDNKNKSNDCCTVNSEGIKRIVENLRKEIKEIKE